MHVHVGRKTCTTNVSYYSPTGFGGFPGPSGLAGLASAAIGSNTDSNPGKYSFSLMELFPFSSCMFSVIRFLHRLCLFFSILLLFYILVLTESFFTP